MSLACERLCLGPLSVNKIEGADHNSIFDKPHLQQLITCMRDTEPGNRTDDSLNARIVSVLGKLDRTTDEQRASAYEERHGQNNFPVGSGLLKLRDDDKRPNERERTGDTKNLLLLLCRADRVCIL